MSIVKPKVQILLSTYNGEKYLLELLESVFAQKDVDITLLVRDDGSKDDTLRMIKEMSKSHPIRILSGMNIGYAKSFWSLVHEADNADYYAFCDQDDIWDSDKLISAVQKIAVYGDTPVLYTSNVDTIDNDKRIIKQNAFPVNGVQTFKQSLLTSILPGCTFVFNKELLDCLKKYDKLVISHDWLTYIIASGVGTVIYDGSSKIKYRIHEGNTLGIQSSLERYKAKLRNFLFPKYPNGRSVVAKNIYDRYKTELKKEDSDAALFFGYYRSSFRYVIKLLGIKEFRNVILDILILLHKA